MCIVQSVTGHAGREERKTEGSCCPETLRETWGEKGGRGEEERKNVRGRWEG